MLGLVLLEDLGPFFPEPFVVRRQGVAGFVGLGDIQGIFRGRGRGRGLCHAEKKAPSATNVSFWIPWDESDLAAHETGSRP